MRANIEGILGVYLRGYLMHIPEMRLLCVAYADNLQFDENDVTHLTQCPACYGRWTLFLHEAENWRQSAAFGQFLPGETN